VEIVDEMAERKEVGRSSHIHGGDLLPFRDLSLFLSQLVGRFVPFLESTRRRSLIIQLPKRQ